MRFALVGSIGFLVDLGSMLLLSIWLPPITARIGSFWLAASSNWLWNRRFTFQAQTSMQRSQQLRQWLHFLFCSTLSFVPNWGCYYLLIKLQPSASEFVLLWPYLAMIPGILIGLLFNYSLSRSWVFANPKA
ncbi:GtrA family protein [Marinomonas pollencensis]|nr:GtrA family protein [Marinomonas pollencensis]